ncbi:MAG TPA: aromatic amino acid lyase [Streptosporangiaceae bacterium]|nr:aromatic amino acid lyase [Streptosporangiaceae bacterium]
MTVLPALVLSSAAALDAVAVRQVSAGRQVRLAAPLLAAVQAQCDRARAVLAGGAAVYGVTTGMGALSSIRLTDSEQRAHQRNLLVGRATGGSPWLPEADVRAIFAVRLRTFLSGDAAVSAELCQRLADFLAARIVPAVPHDGAGSAGEIIQLAHCFGPLAGLGSVLAPGAAADACGADGVPAISPAADVLAERGLAAYQPGPKEGIALLAGVPGATALSILAAGEAESLASMMTAAAGLSIAVIAAPPDPYAAACARADEVLADVLGSLRAITEPAGQVRMLQAPVSFRVAGPVLAHVRRALTALAGAADRALAGVTDSPAFLDGKFTGTAGFHGIDLAAHCDHLTAAITHAAEVAAARLHRLLDPAVTGLPAQLSVDPGPGTGLVAVHKRAAGEVHAMRRLALPTVTGLIETSGGQEDVQSFGWEAAVNLRAALRRGRAVAACEALAAFQAASLGAPPWPPGCQALLDRLGALVEPILADRLFGEDIELLSAGSWTGRPGA